MSAPSNPRDSSQVDQESLKAIRDELDTLEGSFMNIANSTRMTLGQHQEDIQLLTQMVKEIKTKISQNNSNQNNSNQSASSRSQEIESLQNQMRSILENQEEIKSLSQTIQQTSIEVKNIKSQILNNQKSPSKQGRLTENEIKSSVESEERLFNIEAILIQLKNNIDSKPTNDDIKQQVEYHSKKLRCELEIERLRHQAQQQALDSAVQEEERNKTYEKISELEDQLQQLEVDFNETAAAHTQALDQHDEQLSYITNLIENQELSRKEKALLDLATNLEKRVSELENKSNNYDDVKNDLDEIKTRGSDFSFVPRDIKLNPDDENDRISNLEAIMLQMKKALDNKPSNEEINSNLEYQMKKLKCEIEIERLKAQAQRMAKESAIQEEEFNRNEERIQELEETLRELEANFNETTTFHTTCLDQHDGQIAYLQEMLDNHELSQKEKSLLALTMNNDSRLGELESTLDSLRKELSKIKENNESFWSDDKPEDSRPVSVSMMKDAVEPMKEDIANLQEQIKELKKALEDAPAKADEAIKNLLQDTDAIKNTPFGNLIESLKDDIKKIKDQMNELPTIESINDKLDEFEPTSSKKFAPILDSIRCFKHELKRLYQLEAMLEKDTAATKRLVPDLLALETKVNLLSETISDISLDKIREKEENAQKQFTTVGERLENLSSILKCMKHEVKKQQQKERPTVVKKEEYDQKIKEIEDMFKNPQSNTFFSPIFNSVKCLKHELKKVKKLQEALQPSEQLAKVEAALSSIKGLKREMKILQQAHKALKEDSEATKRLLPNLIALENKVNTISNSVNEILGRFNEELKEQNLRHAESLHTIQTLQSQAFENSALDDRFDRLNHALRCLKHEMNKQKQAEIKKQRKERSQPTPVTQPEFESTMKPVKKDIRNLQQTVQQLKKSIEELPNDIITKLPPPQESEKETPRLNMERSASNVEIVNITPDQEPNETINEEEMKPQLITRTESSPQIVTISNEDELEDLHELRDMLESLQNRMKACENTTEDLLQEIEQTKEEQGEVKGKFNQLRKTVKGYNNEIEKAKESTHELALQLHELKLNNEQANNDAIQEIELMKNNEDAVNTNLSNLTAQIQNLGKALESQKERFNQDLYITNHNIEVILFKIQKLKKNLLKMQTQPIAERNVVIPDLDDDEDAKYESLLESVKCLKHEMKRLHQIQLKQKLKADEEESVSLAFNRLVPDLVALENKVNLLSDSMIEVTQNVQTLSGEKSILNESNNNLTEIQDDTTLPLEEIVPSQVAIQNEKIDDISSRFDQLSKTLRCMKHEIKKAQSAESKKNERDLIENALNKTLHIIKKQTKEQLNNLNDEVEQLKSIIDNLPITESVLRSMEQFEPTESAKFEPFLRDIRDLKQETNKLLLQQQELANNSNSLAPELESLENKIKSVAESVAVVEKMPLNQAQSEEIDNRFDGILASLHCVKHEIKQQKKDALEKEHIKRRKERPIVVTKDEFESKLDKFEDKLHQIQLVISTIPKEEEIKRHFEIFSIEETNKFNPLFDTLKCIKHGMKKLKQDQENLVSENEKTMQIIPEIIDLESKVNSIASSINEVAGAEVTRAFKQSQEKMNDEVSRVEKETEEKLNNLDDRFENLKETINMVKNEVKKAHEFNELQRIENAMNSGLNSLKNEFNDQIKQLQDEIDRLSKENENLKSESFIPQPTEELTKTESALSSIKGLKREMKILQQAHKALKEDSEATKRLLPNLIALENKVNTISNSVNEILGRFNEELKEQNLRHAESLHTIQTLQSQAFENSALDDRFDRLNHALRCLKHEMNKQKQAEIKKQRKERSQPTPVTQPEFESTMKPVKKDIRNLQQTVQQLKKSIEELPNDIITKLPPPQESEKETPRLNMERSASNVEIVNITPDQEPNETINEEEMKPQLITRTESSPQIVTISNEDELEDLHELRDMLESLQNRMKACENTTEDLLQEIEQTKEEQGEVKGKFNQLRKTVKGYNNEIEKAKESTHELALQLHELKLNNLASHKDLNEEIALIKHTEDAANNNISNVAKTLTDLRNKVESDSVKFNDHISQTNNNVANLSHKLQKLANNLENLPSAPQNMNISRDTDSSERLITIPDISDNDDYVYEPILETIKCLKHEMKRLHKQQLQQQKEYSFEADSLAANRLVPDLVALENKVNNLSESMYEISQANLNSSEESKLLIPDLVALEDKFNNLADTVSELAQNNNTSQAIDRLVPDVVALENKVNNLSDTVTEIQNNSIAQVDSIIVPEINTQNEKIDNISERFNHLKNVLRCLKHELKKSKDRNGQATERKAVEKAVNDGLLNLRDEFNSKFDYLSVIHCMKHELRKVRNILDDVIIPDAIERGIYIVPEDEIQNIDSENPESCKNAPSNKQRKYVPVKPVSATEMQDALSPILNDVKFLKRQLLGEDFETENPEVYKNDNDQGINLSSTDSCNLSRVPISQAIKAIANRVNSLESDNTSSVKCIKHELKKLKSDFEHTHTLSARLNEFSHKVDKMKQKLKEAVDLSHDNFQPNEFCQQIRDELTFLEGNFIETANMHTTSLVSQAEQIKHLRQLIESPNEDDFTERAIDLADFINGSEEDLPKNAKGLKKVISDLHNSVQKQISADNSVLSCIKHELKKLKKQEEYNKVTKQVDDLHDRIICLEQGSMGANPQLMEKLQDDFDRANEILKKLGINSSNDGPSYFDGTIQNLKEHLNKLDNEVEQLKENYRPKSSSDTEAKNSVNKIINCLKHEMKKLKIQQKAILQKQKGAKLSNQIVNDMDSIPEDTLTGEVDDHQQPRSPRLRKVDPNETPKSPGPSYSLVATPRLAPAQPAPTPSLYEFPEGTYQVQLPEEPFQEIRDELYTLECNFIQTSNLHTASIEDHFQQLDEIKKTLENQLPSKIAQRSEEDEANSKLLQSLKEEVEKLQQSKDLSEKQLEEIEEMNRRITVIEEYLQEDPEIVEIHPLDENGNEIPNESPLPDNLIEPLISTINVMAKEIRYIRDEYDVRNSIKCIKHELKKQAYENLRLRNLKKEMREIATPFNIPILNEHQNKINEINLRLDTIEEYLENETEEEEIKETESPFNTVGEIITSIVESMKCLKYETKKIKDALTIHNQTIKPLMNKVEKIDEQMTKSIPSDMKNKLQDISEEVRLIKEDVYTRAPNSDLNRLKNAVNEVETKLLPLATKKDLDQLKSDLKNIDKKGKKYATKDDINNLKSIIKQDNQQRKPFATKKAVDKLKEALEDMESKLQPLATKKDIEKLKGAINDKYDEERSATQDDVERLKSALEELNAKPEEDPKIAQTVQDLMIKIEGTMNRQDADRDSIHKLKKEMKKLKEPLEKASQCNEEIREINARIDTIEEYLQDDEPIIEVIQEHIASLAAKENKHDNEIETQGEEEEDIEDPTVTIGKVVTTLIETVKEMKFDIDIMKNKRPSSSDNEEIIAREVDPSKVETDAALESLKDEIIEIKEELSQIKEKQPLSSSSPSTTPRNAPIDNSAIRCIKHELKKLKAEMELHELLQLSENSNEYQVEDNDYEEKIERLKEELRTLEGKFNDTSNSHTESLEIHDQEIHELKDKLSQSQPTATIPLTSILSSSNSIDHNKELKKLQERYQQLEELKNAIEESQQQIPETVLPIEKVLEFNNALENRINDLEQKFDTLSMKQPSRSPSFTEFSIGVDNDDQIDKLSKLEDEINSLKKKVNKLPQQIFSPRSSETSPIEDDKASKPKTHHKRISDKSDKGKVKQPSKRPIKDKVKTSSSPPPPPTTTTTTTTQPTAAITSSISDSSSKNEEEMLSENATHSSSSLSEAKLNLTDDARSFTSIVSSNNRYPEEESSVRMEARSATIESPEEDLSSESSRFVEQVLPEEHHLSEDSSSSSLEDEIKETDNKSSSSPSSSSNLSKRSKRSKAKPSSRGQAEEEAENEAEAEELSSEEAPTSLDNKSSSRKSSSSSSSSSSSNSSKRSKRSETKPSSSGQVEEEAEDEELSSERAPRSLDNKSPSSSSNSSKRSKRSKAKPTSRGHTGQAEDDSSSSSLEDEIKDSVNKSPSSSNSSKRSKSKPASIGQTEEEEEFQAEDQESPFEFESHSDKDHLSSEKKLSSSPSSSSSKRSKRSKAKPASRGQAEEEAENEAEAEELSSEEAPTSLDNKSSSRKSLSSSSPSSSNSSKRSKRSETKPVSRGQTEEDEEETHSIKSSPESLSEQHSSIKSEHEEDDISNIETRAVPLTQSEEEGEGETHSQTEELPTIQLQEHIMSENSHDTEDDYIRSHKSSSSSSSTRSNHETYAIQSSIQTEHDQGEKVLSKEIYSIYDEIDNLKEALESQKDYKHTIRCMKHEMKLLHYTLYQILNDVVSDAESEEVSSDQNHTEESESALPDDKLAESLETIKKIVNMKPATLQSSSSNSSPQSDKIPTAITGEERIEAVNRVNALIDVNIEEDAEAYSLSSKLSDYSADIKEVNDQPGDRNLDSEDNNYYGTSSDVICLKDIDENKSSSPRQSITDLIEAIRCLKHEIKHIKASKPHEIHPPIDATLSDLFNIIHDDIVEIKEELSQIKEKQPLSSSSPSTTPRNAPIDNSAIRCIKHELKKLKAEMELHELLQLSENSNEYQVEDNDYEEKIERLKEELRTLEGKFNDTSNSHTESLEIHDQEIHELKDKLSQSQPTATIPLTSILSSSNSIDHNKELKKLQERYQQLEELKNAIEESQQQIPETVLPIEKVLEFNNALENRINDLEQKFDTLSMKQPSRSPSFTEFSIGVDNDDQIDKLSKLEDEINSLKKKVNKLPQQIFSPRSSETSPIEDDKASKPKTHHKRISDKSDKGKVKQPSKRPIKDKVKTSSPPPPPPPPPTTTTTTQPTAAITSSISDSSSKNEEEMLSENATHSSSSLSEAKLNLTDDARSFTSIVSSNNRYPEEESSVRMEARSATIESPEEDLSSESSRFVEQVLPEEHHLSEDSSSSSLEDEIKETDNKSSSSPSSSSNLSKRSKRSKAKPSSRGQAEEEAEDEAEAEELSSEEAPTSLDNKSSSRKSLSSSSPSSSNSSKRSKRSETKPVSRGETEEEDDFQAEDQESPFEFESPSDRDHLSSEKKLSSKQSSSSPPPSSNSSKRSKRSETKPTSRGQTEEDEEETHSIKSSPESLSEQHSSIKSEHEEDDISNIETRAVPLTQSEEEGEGETHSQTEELPTIQLQEHIMSENSHDTEDDYIRSHKSSSSSSSTRSNHETYAIQSSIQTEHDQGEKVLSKEIYSIYDEIDNLKEALESQKDYKHTIRCMKHEMKLLHYTLYQILNDVVSDAESEEVSSDQNHTEESESALPDDKLAESLETIKKIVNMKPATLQSSSSNSSPQSDKIPTAITGEERIEAVNRVNALIDVNIEEDAEAYSLSSKLSDYSADIKEVNDQPGDRNLDSEDNNYYGTSSDVICLKDIDENKSSSPRQSITDLIEAIRCLKHEIKHIKASKPHEIHPPIDATLSDLFNIVENLHNSIRCIKHEMKKKGIQQPFDNENSEGAAFTLNLNDQSSASVSPNEDIIELQKENSNIWKELEKLKKDIEQIENNQYENDDDVKFKLDIESTEYSEIQNEIHDMTSKLNISKSNIDSISYSIKCIKHEIKKLISNHENTKSQVSFTLEEPNQPNFDEVYEEIGNLKSRFAQDLENINKQLELIREAQNSFINASTLDLLLGNNNSESSPEILSPVFIEKLHDQVNQLITNNSDMTKSMKCIKHELVKQQKFINDLKMQSLVMERSVTAIIPEDSSSEGSKEIDTRISDIEQRLIDIEKQSMNEVLDKIQNEINNIKASNDKDGVPFMMEVSDVSDKPNNFEEILDDKINDLKSEFENRCRELEEQIETFQEAQNNFVDKDAVNLLLGDNEIDEDQVRNLISTNIEQLQNEIDEVKNDPRTLKHERDVRCLKHETKKLKLKLSQQKKIAKENSGIPFKLESDSFEDSIPQLQNVIQQLKDEIEDIRTDQLQVVQNQSMQIPMNDLFQEQFEKYNKTINKLQTDMHQLKKKSNNQPTNDSTMISTAQTEIDELRDEITRMKDNLAKNGNDMPIQITMDDYTNLSTGEIDDINHDISQLRSLLNSSISETKTKLEYLENMIDQIKQNNNYSDMPLKIELNDNSDSSMNNEIMSEINDMKKTLNHLTEKVNGLQTQTLSINETIEQINNKANDEASFTPYKIEINDNDISINNEIINEMADMKKAFNDLVEKVEEIQNSTNQSIEQFNNKFNEEPSFAPYKIELNDSDSSIHETIADIQDHTQKTSNDVQDLRKTVENLLNTVNHLIDINDRNHSDVPLKIELHDSDDYERVDVNEFSNLKNMINLSSSKSNEIQKAIDEIRKDLYEIKDAQQKGVTISLENNSDYLSDDKEELIKNFINQEIANSVRNTINENNEKIYSSIKCIKFEVKKLKKNIHEIEANQALNVEERNLVLESDSDSYQNKNEQYFTDFNNKLNYITQNFDKLNEEIKELKQSKNNNVLQLELTGGDSSSSINESEHALSNKHNSLAIDNILHSIEDLNNKIINIQNDIENTNERQSNNLNLTLDVHEDNYATLDEIDSIKDYINKLQEKVENLEAEQQQLNNDKIEAIVPISNMDELFAALNDRINTLESEITNNKLSINHLKSNLSYLSPPQQEKEVRIIHQQDDGIHLIPGINDSTLAEILDRLNSFDASLNELNKLKDTISSQQAKLAEQEKFINRMNDSTSAIPINFDNPEEIENIKNDLEKMNESIDKLEKQSFATSPSSYKQKTELRLVQEYDEAGIHLIPDVNDDSISEIISHLNQLTTRVEEYEKSFKYTIENLKQEIEDNLNAHNENATFKLTDNSSSASQIDDIKENIENLKYEITDLKKHVEEIEKHPNHIQVIREMDERGIRLIPNVNDATVSELQDKVKSLEFKLSTATTPIPSTTAAETYQNPFAGDEAQIEKLHNSMKSITQTVNQQTAYIKKHKAKIGALQSSFDEAQEVIKHLKEEVEGNSQKVNLQNKYIQKHNKEISTIKNELSTLREDGMSSGSDIDNKTRSLIKKNAREIAKMKESLNIITETEAKVDEMQTELAKMKGTNFEDFDIMKMMSQNKDADVSTFVKALAEKLMNTEKMIESIQHDTKMLKKEVFPNDKMPTSQKVMVIGSPSKIKSPSIRSNQEKRKSGTVKHEPLNFD